MNLEELKLLHEQIERAILETASLDERMSHGGTLARVAEIAYDAVEHSKNLCFLLQQVMEFIPRTALRDFKKVEVEGIGTIVKISPPPDSAVFKVFFVSELCAPFVLEMTHIEVSKGMIPYSHRLVPVPMNGESDAKSD